jgi:hypothetical protein
MRHARTQWMVMEGKPVAEACQQIIAHAEAMDCKRTPVFHRPFFVPLNLVMYEARSFFEFFTCHSKSSSLHLLLYHPTFSVYAHLCFTLPL